MRCANLVNFYRNISNTILLDFTVSRSISFCPPPESMMEYAIAAMEATNGKVSLSHQTSISQVRVVTGMGIPRNTYICGSLWAVGPRIWGPHLLD